jgi:multiple sugar transport system ATP-binding protein
MPALSVRSIDKTFGTTPVLRGVSLEVEAGEFVALLGASGSGKSTLLRIIAGLESPDAGDIQIAGSTVTALPPAARDLAMVFQSYALYPHKTVAENIAVPLEMRRLRAWQRLPLLGRLSPKARAARLQIDADVKAAAAIVGMQELLHRLPSQLSGGQRQRAALARAMVRHPRLLLMDEPLSNLDSKLRAKLRTEISELHARTKATIVYVTHDQAEAMTMAHRVAVMVDGRIVQIGPPQALYAQPNDLRVAEMLGQPAINVVTGHVTDQCVLAGGFHWPLHYRLPARTVVRLGFRPESVVVLPWMSGEPAATVHRIEHLGAELLVHIALPAGDRIIARAQADRVFQPGDCVRIDVRPERLLLFSESGERLSAPALSRCA